MDFNKCSRCGSFYISQGNVCPKCMAKENLEFSTFQSYIKENGLNENLDTISGATGISVKNLNRFLGYEGLDGYSDSLGNINIEKAKKCDKIGNISLY